MFDVNITITPGILIVLMSWLCGTIYSIIRKEDYGIKLAFWITVFYGLYITSPHH